MKTSEKRQQILDTADRLFELQGFNATGVDQIAQDSGVTKRTLYKQFGSKEGLIKEVLIAHHARMMTNVQNRILGVSSSPQKKLMACFDYYYQWFSAPHFSGCIFIKTLNEHGGCSTELGRIAQDAKGTMRDFMIQIAKEGKLKKAKTLAMQLQLLLEGSIVMAQAGQKEEAMQAAKEVARKLIGWTG